MVFEKSTSRVRGSTPLHWAASDGDSAMINRLLDLGAEIDAVNEDLQTALHVSASNGFVNAARVLVNRGANNGLRDRNGMTAEMLARAIGAFGLANILHRENHRPCSDRNL